jgi:hypothetical protein
MSSAGAAKAAAAAAKCLAARLTSGHDWALRDAGDPVHDLRLHLQHAMPAQQQHTQEGLACVFDVALPIIKVQQQQLHEELLVYMPC